MLKLRGLYYITHIDNIPSILERGILCHRLIEKENIKYTPIYNVDIVASKKEKKLPDGRNLWDFANLYFQPRNAMLYRVVLDLGIENIAIVGLKNSILYKEDIFIENGNTASPYTIILPIKQARKHIKDIRKKVDREWWALEDGSKRELMAECLVPGKVSSSYISEIYVPNHEVKSKLQSKIPEVNIPIIPEPELFFLPSRSIELTENLSLVNGDMFFSRMQTLTISVNTVGVMGKGLASRTKYQFPDVYVKYQDLCKKGILKMGKPYLYKREASLDYILADEPEKLTDLNLQTWFLLFPTKNHWKEMANLNGVEEGLKWLVENYKKEGIKSLAVPALGCGLGGLPWWTVGPMLCRYLRRLELPVKLYLPREVKIPEEQLSKKFLLGD
ncbi:MAG: DarT ssDNA thymidine ADP-ribosyltransferase family protein [bacterium]